ncbi:hypothetical protein D3C81_822720 [compost metagenome]
MVPVCVAVKYDNSSGTVCLGIGDFIDKSQLAAGDEDDCSVDISSLIIFIRTQIGVDDRNRIRSDNGCKIFFRDFPCHCVNIIVSCIGGGADRGVFDLHFEMIGESLGRACYRAYGDRQLGYRRGAKSEIPRSCVAVGDNSHDSGQNSIVDGDGVGRVDILLCIGTKREVDDVHAVLHRTFNTVDNLCGRTGGSAGIVKIASQYFIGIELGVGSYAFLGDIASSVLELANDGTGDMSAVISAFVTCTVNIVLNGNRSLFVGVVVIVERVPSAFIRRGDVRMLIIDARINNANLQASARIAIRPCPGCMDLIQRSAIVLRSGTFVHCLIGNRVPGAVLIDGFDARDFGKLWDFISRNCNLKAIQHRIVLIVDFKVQTFVFGFA